MSIVLPSVAVSNLLIPLRNMPVAILNKATVEPRSLLAQFNWATDYGAGTAKPAVNVLVNLQSGQGGAQQQIDQVRSVKIDNLGNPAPVYVYFLDTTDTIVAPANTIVWEPVVTNSKIANVILDGASDGSGVGRTKVYFCNYFVPPYVNAEISQAIALYKGSPTIQRTNTLQPGFGPPALGDQGKGVQLAAGIVGDFAIMLPATTGFYYITSLAFAVAYMQMNFNTAGQQTGAINFSFQNLATGDKLFPMEVAGSIAAGSVATLNNVQIMSLGSVNFRLNASANYAVVIDGLVYKSGPSGITSFAIDIFGFVGYTLNPQ